MYELRKLQSEYFCKEKNPDGLLLQNEADKDIEEILRRFYQTSVLWNISPSVLLTNYGLPNEISEMINEWQFKNEFSALYCLLNKLSAIIQSKDMHTYVENLIPGFECLNNNKDTTGILIIPRFHGINESIEDGSSDFDSTGEETKKKYKWAYERSHLQFLCYSYIEEKKLSVSSGRKFHVRNFITPKIYGKKTVTENLIIAVSPMIKADLLNWSVNNNQEEGMKEYTFQIDGIKNPETIYDRIKAVFRLSCAQNVDILMFPEMLGDNITSDKNYWRELIKNAMLNNESIPKLIITPSWWHDFSNESFLFDESSDHIFTQQKHFPFDFEIPENGTKKNVKEDLRNNNNIINILHVPKIGKIVVAICKDFLIEPYTNILVSEINPSILLIPSFSLGSKQFSLAALGPEKYGCYLIWLNTCSAFYQNHIPSYIGNVVSPFIKEEQDKWFLPLNPKCGEKCGGNSDCCVFLIKIGYDDNLERTLSLEHIFEHDSL